MMWLVRLALNRRFPERAEQIFALNVPSNLATRLSYRLDWRGPAAVIDTGRRHGLNLLQPIPLLSPACPCAGKAGKE